MSLAMDVVDTFDLTKMQPSHITFSTVAVQAFEPVPGEVGTSRPKLTKDGAPIYANVDYVTVRQPGDVNSVIFEAEHWIKKIIPSDLDGKRMHPAHAEYYKKAYARYKEGQEIPVEGTAIKLWPVATAAQVALLNSLNIRTVEELANLSDEGLKRIGMGAIELKMKAKAWLAAAKDKSGLTEEMLALQKKNELLELNMAAMKEQLDLLAKDKKK